MNEELAVLTVALSVFVAGVCIPVTRLWESYLDKQNLGERGRDGE